MRIQMPVPIRFPMQSPIRLLTAFIVFSGAMLAGCATPKGSQPDAMYDFGSLRALPTQSARLVVPPISVADIRTPGWLDTTAMFYRLNYANDQQPRPYASNRWSMPPSQLFAQRLKARIAQAGGVALPAADGAVNVPVLRMEMDDFIQVFDTPGQSAAQVALRAAVFNGRMLVTQRNFTRQAQAPNADAAGGAKALADASDALIADMMVWLAALPLAAPPSTSPSTSLSFQPASR